MVISTESTTMYEGNKSEEDMCYIQGIYSRLFEHCSMNRKDDRLHDDLDRKYT